MFGPSHPNNGLSIKNRSGLRYCDVPLPRMQARKPPGMVLKPVVNNGINYHINWLAGFLPSTVSPVHPIYSARLPQPVNKFQERHHKVFVVGLPQESSPRSNLCVYSIYIILYIIYVYYVYIYIYFKQKTLHISSGIYIHYIYTYIIGGLSTMPPGIPPCLTKFHQQIVLRRQLPRWPEGHGNGRRQGTPP